MRRPKEVIAVYDQPDVADRYTVVLDVDEGNGLRGCIGMSAYPSHPQGISQYSGCQVGPHLGQRIAWRDLPDGIRAHVVAPAPERSIHVSRGPWPPPARQASLTGTTGHRGARPWRRTNNPGTAPGEKAAGTAAGGG